MSEPFAARKPAAHDAQSVVALDARVRVAPLCTHHRATARGREDAVWGARRKLSKEAHEVGRGTHEAAGGRDRVGLEVARNDAASGRQPTGMAASERLSLCQGHIVSRFFEPGGGDDFAHDPVAVAFAAHYFDDQPEERITVVR